MTSFEKAVVILTALFAVLVLTVNILDAPQPYDLTFSSLTESAAKPSGELVYDGQIIQKVNPNTADLGELTVLPGIGEVLAQRIVEFREKNGLFNNPEDLLAVKGIGPAKLEKIQKFLAFN